MSRGPDAGTLFQRALERSARGDGCPVVVIASDWTRWASATFSGMRHMVSLAGAESAALRDWIASLPEIELDLRGHLVADVAVTAISNEQGRMRIALEALTVEQ